MARTAKSDPIQRPSSVDAFWGTLRVDPIEVALPRGVGYTLRAYRLPDEISGTDVSEREADEFPRRARVTPAEADEEPDPWAEAELQAQRDEAERDDAELQAELDDTDEAEVEAALAEAEDEEQPEEVPVFLSHRGRLLLFRSAEGMVEFVRSGGPHDLSQVDTWDELTKTITVDSVVPTEDDTYELDLVVENLRAGRDAWSPSLLIPAGEIARDIAYALRLDSVTEALGPGSPLDDLDEALRDLEEGGLRGLKARRRLRKIGAEAAPLGWRTVIGKISSIVDWRD